MLKKKLGNQKKHFTIIPHSKDVFFCFEHQNMPVQIYFCLKNFQREIPLKQFFEHSVFKFITAGK